MRSIVRMALVTLALASAAATTGAQETARPRADRNRLTVEDLRAAPATTIYQIIRSKRPGWLRVRGESTFRTRDATDMMGRPTVVPVQGEIVVYVDNIRRGSQETLKSLYTDDVDSVEHLDAATATQQFGTGHEHGAILVRLRVR